MLNDLVSKLVPGRKELIFKGFSPNSQGKQTITLYDNDIRGDWKEWNAYAGAYGINDNIVFPSTVRFFTGKTDINGRQIWTGDKISCVFNEYTIGEGIVHFGEYWHGNSDEKRATRHYGFYIEITLVKYDTGYVRDIEKECEYFTYSLYALNEIEVIGDIFNTRVVE